MERHGSLDRQQLARSPIPPDANVNYQNATRNVVPFQNHNNNNSRFNNDRFAPDSYRSSPGMMMQPSSLSPSRHRDRSMSMERRSGSKRKLSSGGSIDGSAADAVARKKEKKEKKRRKKKLEKRERKERKKAEKARKKQEKKEKKRRKLEAKRKMKEAQRLAAEQQQQQQQQQQQKQIKVEEELKEQDKDQQQQVEDKLPIKTENPSTADDTSTTTTEPTTVATIAPEPKDKEKENDNVTGDDATENGGGDISDVSQVTESTEPTNTNEVVSELSDGEIAATSDNTKDGGVNQGDGMVSLYHIILFCSYIYGDVK